MIPQDVINAEFRSIKLRQSLADRDAVMLGFKYSGYKLLDKIGKDEKILDIGCGRNLFKSKRPNLIGIDPVFDEADIKVAFQDFETTEKFDVILCLGSVQFGTLDDIKFLIKKLTGMIKPGGRVYWRCNPNKAKPWKFSWTKELHYSIAEEFGYSIADMQDDYVVAMWESGLSLLIYAEWIKK